MIASVAATVPFSSADASLSHQVATLTGQTFENPAYGWRQSVAALPAPITATQRLRAATALCLGVVIATLSISFMGFVAGIIAYDAIGSQDRGSFWAHVPVLIGSAAVITGVKHQRAKWISIGLLFNILSMVLTFCGAIIDGLSASKLQGIAFPSCAYAVSAATVCNVTSSAGSASAVPGSNGVCSLPVSGSSCYCCQVYQQACDRGYPLSASSTLPYYFSDVSSCDYVSDVYCPMLWLSSVSCGLTFVLLTAGVAVCAHYAACLSKVQPLQASGALSSDGQGPPIYETALPVLPPSYDDTRYSSVHPAAAAAHIAGGSAAVRPLDAAIFSASALATASLLPPTPLPQSTAANASSSAAQIEYPPPYAP